MSVAQRNSRASSGSMDLSPVVILVDPFVHHSPQLSHSGTEGVPADPSAAESEGEKPNDHSGDDGAAGEGEAEGNDAALPQDEEAAQPAPAVVAAAAAAKPLELPNHADADGLFLDSSRSGGKFESLCVVCFDHARDTRLPCGHSVMCKRCAKGVLRRSKQCPTCRSPFGHFFVNPAFPHEPAFRPCTDQDKAHRVVTEEEVVRRLRQRDPQLMSQLEREHERQRLASLELDAILSSFLEGIDDRADSQTPQRHRCLHLVLTVTLICIFQGFIFMDCNNEQACQCNEHRFGDGYTCADMCACEGGRCDIGLNTTQRHNFCQGTQYRAWAAYASESCWSDSNKYRCERNISGYLFMLGMCTLFLLLVHVFCRSCCHVRPHVEDPRPSLQDAQQQQQQQQQQP